MPYRTFLVILALAALASPALAAAGDCAGLSGLQVAAGFVTWLNVLRVMVVVGAIACLGVLLCTWFSWLLAAFAAIPAVLYETLGYAAAACLVASGGWVPDQDAMWPVLGGSLLFGAMLVVTGKLHDLKPNHARFFGSLFIVWTAVALWYGNEVVGFAAVGAFMGMLGFSAAVIPMGYAIGFEDRDAVPRVTSAAFLTTVAAVAWRVALPAMHNPLLPGALWLGPFVLSLGLLITASRYYGSNAPYAIRQVGPAVAMMAMLAAGNVLGIPQLSGIGGTFLVLFVAEKVSDIPAESATGYATVGLMTCLVLGAMVWWAQNHMDVVAPYLLF